MPDEEALAKGFIKGYEAGLRQAYDEVINLAMKKSFTPTELLLVVKNQRVAIPEKVMVQKRRILKETGVDLINPNGVPKMEVEEGVTSGSSLLVKESSPIIAFKIFNQLMANGAKGIVLSRRPRENAKAIVSNQCDIYWLTKFEIGDDGNKEWNIPPTDLANLYMTIKKYLITNKTSDMVILLDGLNYLISNNDFTSILKTIQKLKDDIYMFHAVFIVTVDPATLQPNEVKQLENEMQNVLEK